MVNMAGSGKVLFTRDAITPHFSLGKVSAVYRAPRDPSPFSRKRRAGSTQTGVTLLSLNLPTFIGDRQFNEIVSGGL